MGGLALSGLVSWGDLAGADLSLSGFAPWARHWVGFASAVTVAGGAAAILLFYSGQRSRIPRVSRLFIHPVKSCAPIEVSAIRFDGLGVVGDRRWAVLDMESGMNLRVVNQRTHPQLAQIVPSFAQQPVEVEPSELLLDAPGMGHLRVPIPDAESSRCLEIALWDVPGVALDCGDEVAKWLTTFLGGERQLRLGYFPGFMGTGAKPRDMCKQASWNGGNEADSVYMKGAHVGFADSTHATVLSEASIVDLNRHLPQGTAHLTAERFRMNILLSGTHAYAEELWKCFAIGDIDFEVARLCNRCIVTLVDPAVGKKLPGGGEPLQTLRNYRSREHLWQVDPRHGTSPILGTKACTASSGIVRIGDSVASVVLRTASDREY